MSSSNSLSNPRSLARLTGALYLLIFFAAGFSQAVVRESVVVAGDAAATANNLLASQGLFRFGIATDLLAFCADLAVAVLLYILLKPADKTLAMFAAVFRLVAHPAIASMNMLNQYNALAVLKNTAYQGAFSLEQLQAWSLQFMNAHTTGYLIAGGMFGISLLFLGAVLRKSELFPNWLAVLVMIAGVGYLIETFGSFIAPDYKSIYTAIVTVTAIAGETVLTFYLLIKGVKSRPAAV